MNIIDIYKKFPTQKSCIKHLEKVRWGKNPVCPYCQSLNTNVLIKEFRHHCNGCRKSFRVTVGTIYHRTHLPLQKWFLAISLILNAKKGVSSLQLSRNLDITQKTAWSLAHRIRKAIQFNEQHLLQGIIEMDEAYIGGKPRKGKNRDNDENNHSRGRGTKKIPVVGMVERLGNVIAQKASKKMLTAKNLMGIVRKHVNIKNSILITDEYKGYVSMGKIIKHESINHSYEYARDHIHTNTIESFWAILKRGIMGQFHRVSEKYLPNYLSEFEYRYNMRKQDKKIAFEDLLRRMCYVV